MIHPSNKKKKDKYGDVASWYSKNMHKLELQIRYSSRHPVIQRGRSYYYYFFRYQLSFFSLSLQFIFSTRLKKKDKT